MVLIFFVVYIGTTIGITTATVRWARRSQRNPWLWGGVAVLIMYHLVFWDFLPTLATHRYYCAKQAGFWVYKTPEQWNIENPGVAETLKESLKPSSQKLSHELHRYWLNQRFYYEIKQHENISHSIGYTEKKLFYAQTSEILARSIDYWRGESGNVVAMSGTLDEMRQALVLGWGNRFCVVDGKQPTILFDQFMKDIYKWGENK